MDELKSLHHTAVPRALELVERYRLLNEPMAAESICRDVLAVEPDNQQALVNLILSLSDQFPHGLEQFDEAWNLISRLHSEYERTYYSGILCERRAKAHLRRRTPASGNLAFEWLRKALDGYEKAEPHRPPGNDDALLRWNTCVRIMQRHPEIKPAEETAPPLGLE